MRGRLMLQYQSFLFPFHHWFTAQLKSLRPIILPANRAFAQVAQELEEAFHLTLIIIPFVMQSVASPVTNSPVIPVPPLDTANPLAVTVPTVV